MLFPKACANITINNISSTWQGVQLPSARMSDSESGGPGFKLQGCLIVSMSKTVFTSYSTSG